MRRVGPSKNLLLHEVIHDANLANNGEIFGAFGSLIAIFVAVLRIWYNLLEDQINQRQYRGKSSDIRSE